jgi:hypothetical protein
VKVRDSQHQPVSSRKQGAVGAILACAAFLVVCIGQGDRAFSASHPPTLTIYSIAEQEQFVNNEDDRSRGSGNNPFGNFKDKSGVAEQQGHGPFAGDESVFAFNLYGGAALKPKIGTAIFTCLYYFNKNAFCEASYKLNGGTVFAQGAFNFNATSFTLAVTGGLGKFAGATGEVATSPSANHSQHLSFTFRR